MIPPRPPETATGSERKVFDLLLRNGQQSEAIALTSLNLSEHEYQRWSEIDFVVISPLGLLVLEVKGGHVTCTDGLWRFSDRWGRVIEKAISPVAQAQGGYSSLLNRFLKPDTGHGVSRRNVMGFCAVFPATNKSQAAHFLGGTGNPPELIGLEEDCRTAATFNAFISRVFDYWRARAKGPSVSLNGQEIRSIVSLLRPSFDRILPLSISLARVREEQIALTEDQYRMLDYLESADRLVCIGAAGTGKTFLAVECLRRAGAKAVLVTGTDSLAEHLRGENVPNPHHILSYAELGQRLSSLAGKFDTLIVDEGQQITNEPALSDLSILLGCPLEEAKWRWFSDPHYQLSSTSIFDPKCEARLERMATKVSLKENCRNTPQIVKAVEFVSGVPLGSTRVKGSGPEVMYAQAIDSQGLREEAAKQIKAWMLEGGVEPGQIMLLSPLRLEESSVPHIARMAGIDWRRWHRGWSATGRTLGACTIEEFRGLESPFLVLCDLGGDVNTLASMLYLGMTRANFAVFVSCERDSMEALAAARIAKAQSSR